MSKRPKNSNSSSDESQDVFRPFGAEETRVDLGDDLVSAPTRVLDLGPDRAALLPPVPPPLPDEAPEEVLERLTRELGLETEASSQTPVPQLSLFMEGDSKLVLSFEDHRDLGIAFFTTGLVEKSLHHLKSAVDIAAKRYWQEEPGSESEDERLGTYLEAVSLLAEVFVASDKNFEAAQILDPLLREKDISPGQKSEHYYLMGRAFEGLGVFSEAGHWYKKVLELAPNYRDTEERLRKNTPS